MARQNYYAVRNERARLAGFKSYGEQRSARRLGYHTAGEFHTARGGSFRLPPPAPAAVPIPDREWESSTFGRDRTGYYTDQRTARTSREILEQIRRAADADPHTRAVIWSGDSMLGTTGNTRYGDGWTCQYIIDYVEAEHDGDFWAWIDTLDNEYGETGVGECSVTIG